MAGKKQITMPAKVKLKIAEEKKLGRNVSAVCKMHEKIINQIKDCIQEELVIGVTDRADNTKANAIGVNADSVNKALRKAMEKIEGIHFETSVENGAFFERRTKSNFDFSFYNRMLNYSKFWNLGRNKTDFDEIIKQSITNEYKASWDEFLEKYKPSKDKDLQLDIAESSIVGEIQFGNWAMIYKDIFRLLRAKNSPGVELLYIYITDTGELNKLLSSQVVEYSKALKEFEENMDIIQTPILIIGLDIESYDKDEFKDAYDKVIKERKRIARKKNKK